MAFTFLIIDAHDTDAEETAQKVLRACPGADVLRAASGEDAVALLEEHRVVPSLALIDHLLPGAAGTEVIGMLRALRWLEGMPIAMVSAPVSDRIVVMAYRMGAVAFLTKPVPAYELRQTVRDFARPSRRLAAATVLPGGRGTLNRTAA